MSSESKTCCSCDAPQDPLEPQTNSKPPSDISHLSVFDVPKMDCPSEENLIRTAFAGFEETLAFEFDLPGRKVRIYHPDMAEKVETAMKRVGLGASVLSVEEADGEAVQSTLDATTINDQRETRVLRWLLGINAVMFLFEFAVGVVAQSTGLIADSLDMFADAAVYGVSLFAVGKAAKLKLKAAHFSGWLQVALAIGVFLEVVRRFLYGSEPVSGLMIGFGIVALIANIKCLLLIFKSRNQGSHMKATWIFSANDVLANVGVIIAGILVAVTGSQTPDLLIGLLIAGLVLSGAVRILKLK